MKLYELIIEDMTTVGRMGSSSTVKERKMFLDPNVAREYAEADYNESIKWHATGKGSWSSGDLMWVMYNIQLRIVE